MNETDRAIAENQQAIILGTVSMIKKAYTGHEPLTSYLLVIESSAEITMDILDREREKVER